MSANRPQSALSTTLAIGMALITAACGSTAVDPSAPPSASLAEASDQPTDPSSTPDPPASPAASVEPAPSGSTGYPYAAGTTIQVVAEAVRIRQSPGTDADVVAALTRDMTAVVRDGPTEADGYTWFQVEAPEGTGWVATGDAENRWIVAAPPVEPAELVLRFRAACDATPPLIPPTLTVTAERDVVMASPDDGRLQRGRLTPAAFSDFMALLALPALAASADYPQERRPDAGEPPGHGLCVFEFTLGPPTDRVRVTSVSWFGDEEESTYYVPSPERRALDELARMLGPGLFSDDSWEVPPAEYPADAYLVWIFADAASPTEGAPSVADLHVLGDLNVFGEPIPSGRCGYLDRAEVEQLAEAFAATPSPLTLNAVSYLTIETGSGWANVVTSPLMPDGFPTCGNVPG